MLVPENVPGKFFRRNNLWCQTILSFQTPPRFCFQKLGPKLEKFWNKTVKEKKRKNV